MPVPGGVQNQQMQVVTIFTRPAGNVLNKRTNQPAVIKPLDGAPMQISSDDDPRQRLVDWMVDSNNPFFARAVANRYWAHFFGRGSSIRSTTCASRTRRPIPSCWTPWLRIWSRTTTIST